MGTKPNSFQIIIFLLLAILTFCAAANENESAFLLIGDTSQTFTRTELLKRPDITNVRIANDVVYKRDMCYQAVPMAALLEMVHPNTDSVIQFVASDGFVAELPAALLLNKNLDQALAYLAVEPADKSWPKLKPESKLSAGPFYLVWLNPQRAHIGPEQWPYQIAQIKIQSSLRKRWPALMPGSEIPTDSPVNRGLVVYQKNCLACHRLNRSGDAAKGPDLNLPMNPTEYFQAEALRKLIRNPRSVRSWSGLSMPGFDEKILPNQELEDLLTYLNYMARRKVDTP